jgi:D-3-phosphoglycerate dehydrogenase / 2-oxoglutarate reductase
MDRPRVLVTAPFRGPGLDSLREVAEVILDPWIDYRPLRIYDPASLAARIDAEGVNVVVCEADECRGPVLDRTLLAIGSTRGDPTNVDVPAATARGIPVLRAPGRNADAVAELTIALLFAVDRRVVVADRDVRAGQMFADGTIPYQRFRAWQLAGRTAGLVGLGAVGRATAWRLTGLGMRVITCDPFASDATHDLPDLLREADVVSMHAAVTPDTVGLIGSEQVKMMRQGAIFLNTARAALHDLDAIMTGLETGKLAGAGLDHFAGEVPPADHPLLRRDDVVLTPHIGGATYDTEANHSAMIAEDLGRLFRGQPPLRLANPEVLD